jgi:hypothetical protein
MDMGPPWLATVERQTGAPAERQKRSGNSGAEPCEPKARDVAAVPFAFAARLTERARCEPAARQAHSLLGNRRYDESGAEAQIGHESGVVRQPLLPPGMFVAAVLDGYVSRDN